MNARLVKEAIIHAWRWLAKQNRFEPDIGAYGVYYLEPPPFKDAIPSIRAFHGLEPFPWPESNCLILIKTDSTDGIMRTVDVVIRSSSCEDYFAYSHVTQFSGENEIRLGMFWRQALDRLDQENTDIDLSDDALRPHVNGVIIDAMDRLELARFAIVRSGPRWLMTDHPDDPVGRDISDRLGDTLSSEAFTESLASITRTVVFLHHLSSLVSPTGYKVTLRPDAFGPQALRRSFGGKPIFSIIQFDRLFNIYKRSNPHDDTTERMVPLHHRRSHPRHHWRRAGLRLEDLPRDPAERQRLVEQRHVPRTVVKECWVGKREFSLEGMRYQVDSEFAGSK